MTALTRADASDLAHLEGVIAAGMQTFVEVGLALREIRDRRLYRSTHRSFEEYCVHRWTMGRRYADRLIQAAGVVENLGTMVPAPPVSERQARPMALLPPEQQRLVWAQVCAESDDDSRKVVARVESLVQQALAALPSEERRAVVEAEEERIISASARADRAEELAALARAVERLRRQLEAAGVGRRALKAAAVIAVELERMQHCRGENHVLRTL